VRILRGIRVDERMRGNSYQDLALSLVGWRLGRMIRAGQFSNTSEVATWIRTNLGAASATSTPSQSSPSGGTPHPQPPTELQRLFEQHRGVHPKSR
jgi:hypothetical protein